MKAIKFLFAFDSSGNYAYQILMVGNAAHPRTNEGYVVLEYWIDWFQPDVPCQSVSQASLERGTLPVPPLAAWSASLAAWSNAARPFSL